MAKPSIYRVHNWQELEQVSMTAEVEISHDTSSPVCKVDKTCYLPFNVKVLEGGIVTWTNTDSFLHEVASGTPETGEDNRFEAYLMPGKTFQRQFTKAGVYKYFCEIHPWATGMVTVYEKSGNVQEVTNAKSVSIIINRPDKTSDRLNVSTNERGYYYIPTVLDKKWQEGVYEIITKFQEKEIGRVTFTIKTNG